jgi:hypothetical protein
LLINNKDKTYIDYSLFDTVGTRAREFENRQRLNRMLAATKIHAQNNTLLDNEHILSVSANSPSKIDELDEDEYTVFANGDRPLLKVSKKGEEISHQELIRFTQYLRYNQGGHPHILDKLANGQHMPAILIFTFNEFWGKSTHTLTIKAIETIDAKSYDLDAYQKHQATGFDSIDDLLTQAENATPDAIELAKVRNQESIAKAFQTGKFLDALLGLIERTLMTGQSMQKLTAEQAAQLGADSAVQQFKQAMAAKNKEELANAAKMLVELRSHASEKSYVLKLFEANDRLQLGERELAKNLFKEVLQGNFLLAGTYKDLGDLLLLQWDIPQAWRAWDIGRRIAPQFANFKAINNFENSLLSQYPNYFSLQPRP